MFHKLGIRLLRKSKGSSETSPKSELNTQITLSHPRQFTAYPNSNNTLGLGVLYHLNYCL